MIDSRRFHSPFRKKKSLLDPAPVYSFVCPSVSSSLSEDDEEDDDDDDEQLDSSLRSCQAFLECFWKVYKFRLAFLLRAFTIPSKGLTSPEIITCFNALVTLSSSRNHEGKVKDVGNCKLLGCLFRNGIFILFLADLSSTVLVTFVV